MVQRQRQRAIGAGTFGPGGSFTPGSGSSTIVGGPGSDVIYGGSGGDSITGSGKPSTIFGGPGSDVIYAGSAGATIYGGGGKDTLHGGHSGDVLYGVGASTSVAESGDLNWTLTDALLVGRDSTGAAVVSETLNNVGSAVVTGGASANMLDASGYSGRADLVGLGGNDTLIGGSGRATLEGGAGDDSLAAGSGDTTFAFSGSGLGADVIAPRVTYGRDALDFSWLSAGVAIDLQVTTPQVVSAAGLTLTLPDARAIQVVVGTAYDDFIAGNTQGNSLVGGGGHDEIVGRGSGNTLVSGTTQAVLLDFDTFAAVPGLHVYTKAERDAIEARLTAIYAAFSYSFSQVAPQAGAYSTILFKP